MDLELIARRIQNTVYAIRTQKGSGTGVSVNIEGDLLTAAHVVSDRGGKKRIAHKNIIARTFNNTIIGEYDVVLPGIDVMLPICKEPILLDVAYLRVKNAKENMQPFINLFNGEIKVGIDVLMAGYPEDVILPFNFVKILDYDNESVKSQSDQLIESNRQLMLKSGIVGNVTKFKFDVGNKSIEGQIFAVDNGMAKGASGGPVINHNSEIIGIIIEQSEMFSSIIGEFDIDVPIPSGVTYAISIKTIITIREVLGFEYKEPYSIPRTKSVSHTN